MTSIILAAGSIGIVCAAGTGIMSALKFFNTWEPSLKERSKSERSVTRDRERGGMHSDKLDNLRRKI